MQKSLCSILLLLLLTLHQSAKANTKAHAKGVTTESYVRQLRAEIARIEALCVPRPGTTRRAVESKFGLGQAANTQKDIPPKGIPEDSPLRSYAFCPNGTLLVYYEKNWKVRWAHFFNPYFLKGQAHRGLSQNQDIVSARLEQERRELEPRLQQMKRILEEYQKRFGNKH